jgi:hypothetical protein
MHQRSVAPRHERCTGLRSTCPCNTASISMHPVTLHSFSCLASNVLALLCAGLAGQYGGPLTRRSTCRKRGRC